MNAPVLTHRKLLVPALLLLALTCAAALGGCNIAGPALFILSDDRTPAAYKLDPKRSAVVFIDDRNSVLPVRSMRNRIAAEAEKQILDAKLLDVKLISADSLQTVVTGERFSRPLSIAEIGRAVQAEQVIYAAIESFSLSPDGSQNAPMATMRVKVIDATNDKRLFPVQDATGGGESVYLLKIEEKTRATGLPRSNSDIVKEQQELADDLGRHLAELFFKHTWRDPHSKIGS